jgi:hypothetical protein
LPHSQLPKRMTGAGWEDLFRGDVGGSDVGGSATSSELGLRFSDGLFGARPRRLPGCPAGWSAQRMVSPFDRSPEVTLGCLARGLFGWTWHPRVPKFQIPPRSDAREDNDHSMTVQPAFQQPVSR